MEGSRKLVISVWHKTNSLLILKGKFLNFKGISFHHLPVCLTRGPHSNHSWSRAQCCWQYLFSGLLQEAPSCSLLDKQSQIAVSSLRGTKYVWNIKWLSILSETWNLLQMSLLTQQTTEISFRRYDVSCLIWKPTHVFEGVFCFCLSLFFTNSTRQMSLLGRSVMYLRCTPSSDLRCHTDLNYVCVCVLLE